MEMNQGDNTPGFPSNFTNTTYEFETKVSVPGENGYQAVLNSYEDDTSQDEEDFVL